jgi:hypothetical protein
MQFRLAKIAEGGQTRVGLEPNTRTFVFSLKVKAKNCYKGPDSADSPDYEIVQ